MALTGDLETMPLAELLQWAGGNQKTGVLELERNKIRKRIAFRAGRIVGCASTDPAALLGHFLISRGQITERTLQYALKQQEEAGRRFSDILVEMGVITNDEVSKAVAESAEETVYGLFEWDNAVFRFRRDASLDQSIEVDVSVDHVLLNGAHRQDELERIRQDFSSSGIVLKRTERPVPEDLEGGALAFSVLGLVDGQRTLADILLQAHAPEFQVLRLLHALSGTGNVEIAEQRDLGDSVRTLIDPRPNDEPAELPSLEEFGLDESAGHIDRPTAIPTAEPKPAPDAEASESVKSLTEPGELAILIQFASKRLESGDPEGAMSMLDACYRARPEDEDLKEVMERAEAAYLAKVRQYLLPPEKVPALAVPEEELATYSLVPAETSVVERIDGKTDVQSIVWTAPQREVEVIRTLQDLHERGLILLGDQVSAT